jgi:hypothetical protein
VTEPTLVIEAGNKIGAREVLRDNSKISRILINTLKTVLCDAVVLPHTLALVVPDVRSLLLAKVWPVVG